MNRRSRLVGCALVSWFALTTVAAAHEIGTTRVSARFEEGRYAIEVVTDAASLVEKLDAVSGTSTNSTSASTDARALYEKLVAHDDLFRGRLAVAFNGTVARPAIAYTVSPASDVASPPLATIRLTGNVPAGARDFTWSYSWTFASYELSLTTAGAQPVTHLLEGAQASAPFPVAIPSPTLSRATIVWLYPSVFFTLLALRLRDKSSDRRGVAISVSPRPACTRPPTDDSTSDPSYAVRQAW